MKKQFGDFIFNKQNLKIMAVSLIIVSLSYAIYVFNFPIKENEYSTELVILFSWLGIILLFLILLTWYQVTGLFLTPYTIFIVILFLFHYGQSIMWALGIHISSEIGQDQIYQGFRYPENNDIVNAQIFILISILMFHTGALFSVLKKNYIMKEKRKDDVDIVTLKSVFIVSIIISIISIPITLYDSVESYNIAKNFGYKSLYYGEHATSTLPIFLGVFTMFFFPSLVGLLIGSRFDKKIRTLVYIVFFVYLLINLLYGDRGSWFFKLIVLMWLSHQFYKPLNIKKILSYSIIFFVSLYFIYAIVNLRDQGLNNLDYDTIFNAISFENSPLIRAIFEMGDSMRPTLMLLMYDWDIWPYGNTYILAVLGMITNKIIYFLDIPFSLISSWYSQEYLGLTYGAGFSIIAEALLNYGPIIAPLFLFVLGFIISSILFVNKKMSYKNYPLKIFFIAGTLHYLLYVVRNFFHLPLKEWFYGIVIYCIIILITKKIINKYSYKYK